MEPRDLSAACIEGSQRVYDFVAKRRNGGAQEINVDAIELVEVQEYKFKLSRTIFDLESITFLLCDTERRYFESDEIKVIVYDQEQRFVIVKTSRDVAELINDTIDRPSAWTLVFDLKFLIKRVIEWYESNGDDLVLLEGRSCSKLKFDSTLIFPDSRPSVEQTAAINLLFTEPLSYIWGAPGTGKTRFVLSYALLTYIKNNAKALILAPTNLALEQIFRGIVGVTDRAKINKRQLLRLGSPTKNFATEYGEICENKGLEIKLKELDRQIEILESIRAIDQLDQPALEAMLVESTWLDKRQKLMRYTDKKISTLKAEIYADTKKSNALHNAVSAHGAALAQSKSESGSTKHKALLVSHRKLIVRKKQILEQLTIKQRYCNGIEQDLKALRKIVDAKEKKLKALAIKAGYTESDLSLAKIAKIKKDSSIERARLFSIAQEYQQFAEHELESKFTQYTSDAVTLKTFSTEVRLISANVIGMTLDSFIARYKDKPIDVDHVFIDEAGYASLVKILPAFITRGPITLLGDHKQLPPVCELNRDDIIKNPNNHNAFVWDLSAIHCESIWRAKSAKTAVNHYRDNAAPVFKNLKQSALTTSYRFGKKLASVLHDYVYMEEGFNSGLGRDTQLSIFNVQNRQGCSDGRIGRRANMDEALCVLKIIEKGLLNTDDFAVLTPYRDQVSLLAKLRPELIDNDQLLTVHKSQGREWHTVVYCVCDIGNGLRPWFTDSANALSGGLANVNTAVSRAKTHLVIVCDSSAWEHQQNQLIRGLIKARSTRYQYQP